ncbi:cytochrome d ubiquinol oxidase subunit II [Streptomyces sedi]|uniref:Cytochrome d ubiquinol oxidase subunit II n=1 Tax=Streptomyces sedi TaxID=555059 RepID=A0A5C4UXV8_9ACTN|nr:cytochrome d ubiquinol oxidase subunit II [Streptomyces sedi]TNM28442.1 cytochrome d ubiquinol oxidase subunit II [Streptomyces sedi]
MEPLAVFLLGCFAVGYFVVGGAGLGLGTLLPLLAGNAAERVALRRATAPLTRLAALWLLATGSALAACFPSVVGELDGVWPTLGPLVGGLLLRAWGLRTPPGAGRLAVRRDVALVAGSWLAVVGWGWSLASLVDGGGSRPAGPATGLFSAALLACLLLAHGVGFAALRATGAPFQRARQLVGPRGAWPSVALTSVTVAVPPLLAGSQLPLGGRAAPLGVLAWLVPALLLGLLVLTALQLRHWRR